jgi:hypothetical protein
VEFWRLTPALLQRLGDQWWQGERLADTRGWAIAVTTAKLLSGREQVSAGDHFPALGASTDDAPEPAPEDMDSIFDEMAAALQ